jgi:outer membrane protein TolC
MGGSRIACAVHSRDRQMSIASNKSTSLACVLVVASAACVHAQSITLSEVYRQVARANPRVMASQAAARAAQARVAGAYRPPDPRLQFGLMNYSLPALAPMATVGMAQLQVMQMLPLGGKLGLSGRIAGTQASASAARAADAVWDARTQAAMAFYDTYAVDAALAIDRETVRLLQDIEKVAAAMYEVGQGRQADVLRAQVEIAKMAGDTVRMRAMRVAMVARLAAAMGSADSAVRGSPALPGFPDTLPTLTGLEQLAINERPMLKAGIEEVAGANLSESLIRKEVWPDLEVGVQYGQRGGEMGVERMGSLMIGASIPVFARSRQLRMRDEAAAMSQMAAADLAAMRAETKARLTEAHATLGRARELATLYRTTIIPQAEATATSSLAAYRVGSVDFMTLLDARMAVNKYRKELVVLAAEEGKAWAELEMLTGRGLVNSGGEK